MKINRRSFIFVVLLLAGPPALGCSWPYFTPEEKYKTHAVVVLAYPIAIANQPKNALASNFRGNFQQTIQWQVLVSWKGKYRPGDILLTRVSYQTNQVCGDGAQRQRAVKLLYLNGHEPYEEMIDSRADTSINDMKYLGQKQRGG